MEKLNVHLYTTPNCNLRCRHCYSSKNKKDNRLLPIEDLVRITKQIVNNYDAYLDVEGGEIFLRNDIDQYFKCLNDHELGRITVTTNGTVPFTNSPEVFKRLDEFRVSIEGHTDELNADIRGIGLNVILSSCEQWIKQGIRPVVRMTLNKKNYVYVKESLDRFYAFGFRRFSFYEYQNVGSGEINEDEYVMDENMVAEAVRIITAATKDYPRMDYIKICLSSKRDNIVSDYQALFAEKNWVIKDIRAVNSLTINYDGHLGVCPWDVGYDWNDNYLYNDQTFITSVNTLINSNAHQGCTHCTASVMKIMYREGNQ